MTIIINPGSGPVDNTTEENALINIKQFVKDSEDKSEIKGIQFERLPFNDENGRYSFELSYGDAKHIVDMPGIPLDKVRYLGTPDQNIWHYPRLYVDGSSWVWMYAVLGRKENWIANEDGIVES